MSNIRAVGDADNREAWLEQRKSYLTASSIYAWRGIDHASPSKKWYFEDNNREAIIQEKFHDFEKEFPPYAQRSMAAGTFDEVHIMQKLGAMLDMRVEPTNKMFVNKRWPHIAATIDGFLHCNQPLPPDNEPYTPPMFCQDPEYIRNLTAELDSGPGTVICEIKKSISVEWSRGVVPEYYIPQVQTQLAVLEMDRAVICAECVFSDPKEKWRKYWDLRPTIIERDPAWAHVLDECNSDFLTELTNYGIV